MNFDHLLITRFNLDFSQLNGSEYKCDDEWHRERFELFNRYCLPSVANQTNKEFTWLILFNEEKREQYKDFIQNTEERLSAIRFIYVSPSKHFRELLTRYIEQNVSTDYFVTTRIDNDDIVSHHFIESIQKKFSELEDAVNQNDIILNAGVGYRLELKFPFRKATKKLYGVSPFLSLVTKKTNSNPQKTVVSNQHHLWHGKASIEEISEEPLWIQLVHKKNVGNKIRSLQLIPHLSPKNFPELTPVKANRLWVGLLILPLQYIVTVFQRIAMKIE